MLTLPPKHPNTNFAVYAKYILLHHFWWVLLLLLAVSITFLVWTEQPLAVVAPIVGSILSLFYFIQKQKLDETRLFREIFCECNKRYDKLNEKLADIVEREHPELNKEEEKILVDYFNLCGEEYLYFSHGFIFPNVWNAWRNGMVFLLKNERVRKFWKKEKSTNSYYDLPL